MKNLSRFAVFASAALALTLCGCSSVKRISDFRDIKVDDGLVPIETVDIYNSNWLLLSLLPIASGDPDNPDGWTTCFFRNKATVENQIKMLENEAKRVGASRAVNVSTTTTDECVILFLFLREKCHTAAVLVK